MRWRIAERYGWPLEYIDGLDLTDVQECLTVWSVDNQAREKKRG